MVLRCCIFQPFDNGGPYDKRFADIIEPAVQAANLEAYRVDRDPTASVPIDTLESEIENSSACLADISTDNPNVWYELGYARARDRPLVMICSRSRPGRLPFDIQHRNVIFYTLDAPRDFEKLKGNITVRLNAELQKEAEVDEIASASPMALTEGLRGHEVAALALIMAIRDSRNSGVSLADIRRGMDKALFNETATSVALAQLEKLDFLHTTGTFYYLNPPGEDWLVSHQEQLQLKREKT